MWISRSRRRRSYSRRSRRPWRLPEPSVEAGIGERLVSWSTSDGQTQVIIACEAGIRLENSQ